MKLNAVALSLLSLSLLLALPGRAHAGPEYCIRGSINCPLSARAAVAALDARAEEAFARAMREDLQGDVLGNSTVALAAAFSSGGRANLFVWFLDFLLAQQGLSVEAVLERRADAVVGRLAPLQLHNLKLLLADFTVAAFYTPYRPLGLLACEVFRFDRRWSEESKRTIASNAVWYAGALPHTRMYEISVPDLPWIDEARGLRFKAHNPSILHTAEGYTMLLRAVNYKHDHGRSFDSLAADGVYRSLYYLLKIDADLRVLSKVPVTIAHVNRTVIRTRFNNEGVEDARGVLVNGSLWFTASAYDQSPHGNICLVLCNVSQTPDAAGEARVESWTLLEGPNPHIHEKNWLPFVHQGVLHAFYAFGPTTTVVRLHPGSGKWDPVHQRASEYDLSHFRGSAGPVPFALNGVAGQLVVVHEVTYQPDGGRWYLHRFVWLDTAWAVKRVSLTWFFDHLGVEYCSGMAHAHGDGGELLLTAGIEEGSARIIGVDAATVRALLRPIPSLT